MADDQDVRRERAQHVELAIEDGPFADRKRALVQATESPGPAAGENGCCPHQELYA